jgi:hypothetical protein
VLYGWLAQHYPYSIIGSRVTPRPPCAGASVHPKGECGDPTTQTCATAAATTFIGALASRADLFANYTKGYTDESGQPHALCAGSDECCEGGVWGDVIPAGTWLLPAHRPH